MVKPISLMLLDDHALIVRFLFQLTSAQKDMRVQGAFTTSRELIDALSANPVDVAVIDFSLSPGDIDGLNLIRGLRLKFPDMKLLVLSGTCSPAVVSLSIRFGATGFLGKDAEPEEILVAIRKVATGQQYLRASMELQMNNVLEMSKNNDDEVLGSISNMGKVFGSISLTVREREVLRCCLEGMTVTSIAEKFSRSVKTISAQKQSSYRKLGIVGDIELYQIKSWFEHDDVWAGKVWNK